MSRNQKVADIFPDHLFWDLDLSKLEVSKDKDIIVPRALYFTDDQSFEHDIKALESIYSRDLILKTLQHTDELISNAVCALIAKRYNNSKFKRFAR